MFERPMLEVDDPSAGANIVYMGRVSTTRQQMSNTEADYDYVKPYLDSIWKGPVNLKVISEQASGLLADRPGLLELRDLIDRRWPRAVLAAEVSRLSRNPQEIYTLVYLCVDNDIRFIAPADNVDTAQEEVWEGALAQAVSRHGMAIPEIRRRVKRTAGFTFRHDGQVSKVQMGYRKLTKEQAAAGEFGPKGSRIGKLTEYQEAFDAWRAMVLAGKRPEDLLRWALEHNVRPGPYVKSGKLSAKLIVAALRHPVIYGLRRFRVTKYKRKLGSGKPTRSKNPQPETLMVPELAFMNKEQWDELQAAMDRWDPRGDRPAGPDHPRHQVPRRKTISPLQHAACACCGGIEYPSATGKIKCKNALDRGDRECWNNVETRTEPCRVALIDAALARMDTVPGSRAAMLDAAWGMLQEQRRRGGNDLAVLDAQIDQLKTEAANLAKAIRKGGKLAFLVEQAAALQTEINQLKAAREAAKEAERKHRGAASREELDLNPRATLLELARTSFEFADLMRLIFPSFLVQPVQALDRPQVRPRGLMTLDLAALVREYGDEVPEGCKPEEIVADLFEPPEHIGHLPRILAERKARLGKSEKASLSVLAAETGLGRMTVKRALRYAKLMEAEGLSEPYKTLTSKPLNASRWKPRKKDGEDPPLKKAG